MHILTQDDEAMDGMVECKSRQEGNKTLLT